MSASLTHNFFLLSCAEVNTHLVVNCRSLKFCDIIFFRAVNI